MAADTLVVRCAECAGAIELMAATPQDVIAVRDVARRRCYLAERVRHHADVQDDERGHRAYCSEKAIHALKA